MTPIIIGDSVKGESHIRHGVERQDSFLIIDKTHKNERTSEFYPKMPDDVRIVAVADGHGSSACPYSKTGSQTAANVFCDTMAELVAKYKEDMNQLFVVLNSEIETSRIAKGIVEEWEKRIIQVHYMNKREVIKDADENIDAGAIWKQYGTTLLGLLITNSFVFAFQLGDGDITFVDGKGVLPFIEGDKILGVETHSISKPSSWKKVITKVINLDSISETPFMYILSTDGWVNSHASEEEFKKTCKDYFALIQERGTEVVESNLAGWLSETSKMGCGDDITTVFAYFDKE